ncbi:MAG: beta-propeller repeat protein [Deltaproteobacteria bacterium]|nr:beta-propeller repeat protein [Deltaproteobacteria bacterium]
MAHSGRARPCLLPRALLAALLFAGLAACQARPSLQKPPLENEGQLVLYLRATDAETDRLTFRLESISALRADGGAVPLALHLREIRGRDPKRERMLASGNLPPGQYVGFSIVAAGASLKGEGGEAALAPQEEKAVSSIDFSIARKQAQVVSLRLRYRESLSGGMRFSPVFSAEIPGRIASGLIGLATGRGGNTVTVFDKTTGRVIAVVPTGAAPSGMALDPVLRRAYLALSGEDSVEAIDLLGSFVVNRRPLVIGDRPEELALTPDRKTLLSANAGSNTVSVIDAVSLAETRRIQVGNGPQSIQVDRLGRRAYVFNTLSSTISVIDLGTLAVMATVATDSGPVRGEFNRAGTRLYVLHRNSPYLAVFDPATLTVLRKVYVGTGGTALKVDSRTDMIYLARRGTREVSIYDPFSFLPIDAYRLGGDASCLAIDVEGNNLLIVSPETNDVHIYQLVGKREIAAVDVGEDPFWVTVTGDR